MAYPEHCGYFVSASSSYQRWLVLVAYKKEHLAQFLFRPSLLGICSENGESLSKVHARD
jgi:hypothetical protein